MEEAIGEQKANRCPLEIEKALKKSVTLINSAKHSDITMHLVF